MTTTIEIKVAQPPYPNATRYRFVVPLSDPLPLPLTGY